MGTSSQNAVENFASFAAVVLVANAAGISTGVTVFCAGLYFFARLAHAIVQISGFPYFMLRTVIFTIFHNWVVGIYRLRNRCITERYVTNGGVQIS